MTWVFAYDIGDDRIRAAVAHVLEQFGDRIQESVFECRLDANTLEQVTRRLQVAIEAPENGNIRVYRACADCLSASFGIGNVATTTSGRACTVI